ncbi:F-box protein At3g07870 [Helianthus annuus]|nr:F-box protein At3g07870 [Helianthus annuus]
MEDDVIPENLILEVLSRLPVKTIIRCKFVCKKWRDLVSDSYFVHLHLSRSPPCLMFHQYDFPSSILELAEVEYEVDYHRLTLHHVKTLNLHLSADPGPREWISLVGSVNGLICLRSVRDSTYVFNPVVEEYMILPLLQGCAGSLGCWASTLGGCGRISGCCARTLSYAFGVSKAGEYKVIRLCCGWAEPQFTVKIEVCTLGTDEWRSLRPTHIVNFKKELELESGVFVNSHVYWIIGGQIYNFDLDTETFELTSSPPGALGDDQESMQMLGVLKGSLSLFSWTSSGFNVWVMKESWYKAITVIQENVNPVLQSLEWKPVLLIDGSEGTSVLIFLQKGTTLLAYCLNTNKILDLDLQGNFWTVMSSYHPSLVRLQNFEVRAKVGGQQVSFHI